jgi:spermidine/putrescine transport system permease protein
LTPIVRSVKFGTSEVPFTIGGGNTVSTFVWGKMRTLDSSVNEIATVLMLMTVGRSALALRLSCYRA